MTGFSPGSREISARPASGTRERSAKVVGGGGLGASGASATPESGDGPEVLSGHPVNAKRPQQNAVATAVRWRKRMPGTVRGHGGAVKRGLGEGGRAARPTGGRPGGPGHPMIRIFGMTGTRVRGQGKRDFHDCTLA